jgi:hypothetical protein
MLQRGSGCSDLKTSGVLFYGWVYRVARFAFHCQSQTPGSIRFLSCTPPTENVVATAVAGPASVAREAGIAMI